MYKYLAYELYKMNNREIIIGLLLLTLFYLISIMYEKIFVKYKVVVSEKICYSL